MMKETFVTFETAKKLKKLGYDWKGYWFYRKDGLIGDEHPDIPSFASWQNYNDSKVAEHFDVECSAPTLADAQKWLREIKKINICVHEKLNVGGLPNQDPETGDYYMTYYRQGYYCTVSENSRPKDTIIDRNSGPTGSFGYYKTYEKALSVAIDLYLDYLLEKDNE